MRAKSERIFVMAFVSNNGSLLHIAKSDISMPINYITSKMNAPSTLSWSERTSEVIALEPQLVDDDKDWILLNLDRVGFYRVNYENKNWRRVIAAIESQRDDFTHQTIAQLTDDALSFAREGRLSYAIALDMVQNLSEDAAMIVWSAASLNLLELNNRLHGLDFYPLFWVSVN
jgi:ERAP1-like C-terminal domain